MATITLRVQWALWGTEAGGSGYHQLACSAGEISRDAVDWVVTRYLPGTPHAGPHSWPQVTIGWLRDDSLGDCLAVGIHDRAVPDAAGPGAVDAHGRTVTRARLYYVRFPDAARSRVSYSDLYEALSAVRLPAASPEPVRADLAVRPGPAPAPAEFALRVAALLLSGYPVCVLGAEDLTVTERLGFLDAVASLLPYGMRARLSVSTWAGSTAAHRFRLFFAAVPRSGAEDIAVAWDQAGTVPNAGGACAAYLSWLREDTVRRVEQLAAAGQPAGFAPEEVRRLLSGLGIAAPDTPAGPDPEPAAPPARPGRRRIRGARASVAVIAAVLLVAALVVIAAVTS